MIRRLKQVGMTAALAGSAWAYWAGLTTGIEDYGRQFEKITTTDPQVQEQLQDKSEEQTRVAFFYFAGSVALAAMVLRTGLRLRDETVEAYTNEFTELSQNTAAQVNHFLGVNRELRQPMLPVETPATTQLPDETIATVD